jgi:hypothetical protein
VSIPGSVAVIEEGTFAECENIVDVVIENGVTDIGANAFYNCKALDNVTIPESVTTIGNDAFKTGAYILAVYITDIASWCNITFGNLEANPLASHNKTYLYINEEAVINELIIPTGVTKINDYALAREGGDIIESIILPETLTTIGKYAFYGTWLHSITIPNSVTSIGDHAFENGWLESVTLGSNLTHIGSYAFKNTSITSVNIPASVTYIGAFAFEDCPNLTSVTLEPKDDWIWTTYSDAEGTTGANRLNNTSLSDSSTVATYLKNTYASKYWIFAEAPPPSLAFTSNGNGTCYVSGIGDYEDSNIDIPSVSPDGDTVISVGLEAFKDNTNITSVSIPNSITSIDATAFAGCTNITAITVDSSNTAYKVENSILYTKDGKTLVLCPAKLSFTNGSFSVPSTVVNIGAYAFYKNTSITTMTHSSSSILKTIGNYAFYECSNLTTTDFKCNSTLTSIGNYAFYKCQKLTRVNGTYYSMPSALVSVGNYAFYACTKLVDDFTSTNSNVKTIGDYAFYQCSALSEIDLSKAKLLQSIGNRAFYSCTKASTVSIGYGYSSSTYAKTTIGSYAFAFNNITSLTIGRFVKTIYPNAFYSCGSLSTCTFKATSAWYACTSATQTPSTGSILSYSKLSSSSTAKELLKSYSNYYWINSSVK